MELRETTRNLMAQVEQATGCPVVVTEDSTLTMMSGVLMAASDRPGHIIRLHPKAPAAVDYYVAYYCGMIQRFFENPPEERFLFGVGEKGRYQFRKLLERMPAFKRLATSRVPATRHSQNLAKRFRQHGEAYFRFITTPDIDPTNNLAEQAIRFVVIDRRITLGTRSETGRRWCERIWTVIATCVQQGRSVFQVLLDSVHAYLSGTSPPSLLPAGP